MFNNKKKYIGARDIAQSMKFLLCMYEDLNSEPQHPGKKAKHGS